MATKVPDVIDYLVTLFTQASTLGAAAAPNTVTVIDGPQVSQAPSELNLYVGMTDPNTDDPVGANSEQQWAALGKQARDEHLTIHCCAEAWSGETDMRTARRAAYGIVAAVETLIQADLTLGGTVMFCTTPVSAEAELRQRQVETGAAAQVTFRIDAKARL